MKRLFLMVACLLSFSAYAATDEEVELYRSVFWNWAKVVSCDTPGYAVGSVYTQNNKQFSIIAFAYRDPPSYDATRYYDVFYKKTAEHRRYIERGELDFCVSLACFRPKNGLTPISEDNFLGELGKQYPKVVPIFRSYQVGGC